MQFRHSTHIPHWMGFGQPAPAGGVPARGRRLEPDGLEGLIQSTTKSFDFVILLFYEKVG